MDGLVETCWNSDQGTPQWIMLEYDQPVLIESLDIQFQGGFVAKKCQISLWRAESNTWDLLDQFHPNDDNSIQHFTFLSSERSTRFRLLLEESSDFFGRVTIYQLGLLLAN